MKREPYALSAEGDAVTGKQHETILRTRWTEHKENEEDMSVCVENKSLVCRMFIHTASC